MSNEELNLKTLTAIRQRIKDADVDLLELRSRMEQRPYRVVDTGIHPKVIADWNKHDLLLVKPEPYKVHRFSIVDFVWVKLIEKMRNYGVPLKVIKSFREELNVSIMDLSTSDQRLLNETLQRELEAFAGGTENFEKIKDQLDLDLETVLPQYLPNQGATSNLLEVSIIVCLFLRTPISYFIDDQGKGVIFNPLFLMDKLYDDRDIQFLFSHSFVSISLTEVLEEVLGLSNPAILLDNLMLISDQEANVIEALREDDLVSVLVRFNNEHEMNLMEIKTIQKAEREARIMDYILSDGYQDITVKTQHGKVVYCENTRKVKLK